MSPMPVHAKNDNYNDIGVNTWGVKLHILIHKMLGYFSSSKCNAVLANACAEVAHYKE